MQKNKEKNLYSVLKLQRKKNLQKKFLSDKDQKEEIGVENIWDMIEKLNLQKNFDKESSKQIFEDLDKNRSGKIKTDDFLDYLSEKLHSENNFQPFYLLIMDELVGKSEKIIIKLKKMKHHLTDHPESLEDIDWIIGTLCESDLYEPDFDTMNKLTEDAKKTKDPSAMGIEYISQYSQYWDKERKTLDMMKVSSDRSERKNSDNNNEVSKRLDTLNTTIIPLVNENLANIDNFDYNIFDLDDLLDRQTLTVLSTSIMQKFNYFEERLLREDKFRNFMKEITNGYDRNVTYHNDLHAGDVLQTTYVIIQRGDLANKLKLQKIDVFATLISAIIHDYKHPGLNNMYHINAKTKFAIRYNDQSVLENFHVSQSFKLIMSNPSCNILDSLSPEEYRLVRRRMIENILATDMANHTKTLATLKSKVETFDIKSGKNIERMIFPENLSKTFENQQAVLSMIVHAADISNPAKPDQIQKTWVDLVFIEFFKQGDLELKQNLPISLLCDRKTTNIDKSQIGFMNFIIIPTFELVLNVVPEVQPYMTYLKSNLKKYEQLTSTQK